MLEESARIALSWIRSNAYELGLEIFPSKEPHHPPASRRNNDTPALVNVVAGSSSSFVGLDLSPDRLSGLQRDDLPRDLAGLSSLTQGGGKGMSVSDASLAEDRMTLQGSSVNPVVNWDFHIHLPAGGNLLRVCNFHKRPNLSSFFARRDPQGRPQCGSDYGSRAFVHALGPLREGRHRHDWRAHPPWIGAACRRHQGEAACSQVWFAPCTVPLGSDLFCSMCHKNFELSPHCLIPPSPARR